MTQRLKDNNITLDENEDNFHEDMYFHLYPDVVTEFDCSQGWVHYTEHGIQEKRIFPPKSLIHKFDKIRYGGFYTKKEIKDLAEMIANITSFKGKIFWDKSKPDGTSQKLLDVSKLKYLGWNSKISLNFL